MERFQKIKGGRRKLDVSSICRFCGLENDEKYNIFSLNEDGVEFTTKISSMMSEINVHSKAMPQNVCFICMDKINDFYEFRLMALNTDKQTREALGLPLEDVKPKVVQLPLPPPPLQQRQRPNMKQIQSMTPVVRLVDLKYSVQDQLLIKKAFTRLAESPIIKKEPNIPKKRQSAASSTVTSQQLQQPPNKKIRKDLSCNICEDANFSYINDMLAHQMKEHLPLVSKYACGSCRETFEQLSDFKDHEIMHSRQKLPYTCFICLAPYAKLKDFQKHMTNYNCAEKEKLEVTVEDIRCNQCKKKFLTQNLFEWHGCFLKTRGACPKCGQAFRQKKFLIKHYVLCDEPFVAPQQARDPRRIKSEMPPPLSLHSAAVKVTGVRKKTVPPRRMTTIKAEKEVNLATHHQQQADEDDDDEYANYEEDITYDNFGSDEDDEQQQQSQMARLEPEVQLQEQEPAPGPRIIDIKAEAMGERVAVSQHTLDTHLIRSIKREQGGKQAVIATTTKAQQQLALRIKAERGVNEQPVVQVLNPLAIGGSAKTPASTITARKKVFKLPHELAARIKKEKTKKTAVSIEYEDGRDEAEPDSEEEAQMAAARDSPPAIKLEKLDSAYGDEVHESKNKLINPMALARMREKSVSGASTNGSESNSLVISAVTSMSANPPANGRRPEEEHEEREPQSAPETHAATDSRTSNSVGVSESPPSSSSQALNPVMVEIPAEFKASLAQHHISPALVEMSSTVSDVGNNEVAATSVTAPAADAMNTNDDDELNQLLENLEKYGGDGGVGEVELGEGVVENNLHDSDLQDLLKFD